MKVVGRACDTIQEGSGWIAGPGLVVTNAHVVAGEHDTSVVTRGGLHVGATPVHYDPSNDLAVLRVPLNLPSQSTERISVLTVLGKPR